MARVTIGEICDSAGAEITGKAFKAGVGLDEALPKLNEATRLLDHSAHNGSSKKHEEPAQDEALSLEQIRERLNLYDYQIDKRYDDMFCVYRPSGAGGDALEAETLAEVDQWIREVLPERTLSEARSVFYGIHELGNSIDSDSGDHAAVASIVWREASHGIRELDRLETMMFRSAD